jgi:hypothetical protein
MLTSQTGLSTSDRLHMDLFLAASMADVGFWFSFAASKLMK